MSINIASSIVIDESKMTLQIVASLTNNSRATINDHNMFIVQARGINYVKLFSFNLILFDLTGEL
jgi:hypothetical protein